MTKPSPTAPPSSPPLNSLALQTQKDRSPSSSRMAARIGKTWPEASLKKYGGLPMMLSWTISLLNAIRPAAFRMMMMMSSSRQKIFWMCFSCYQRNLWSETCSKQTYWWLISQNLIPYSHNIHLCLIRTIFMCTPGVGLCWDWHIQYHIRLGNVGIVSESTYLSKALSRAWWGSGARPPRHPTYGNIPAPLLIPHMSSETSNVAGYTIPKRNKTLCKYLGCRSWPG